MTKTSHRWQTKPGNFDNLRASQLFPSDNRWGVPTLRHTPMTHPPVWLAPYRQPIAAKKPLRDGAAHFFVDDYHFETVWNRPEQTAASLASYGAVLTPDFSLYRDWPLTLQLWNVYRNRWCGRFWQERGFTVIPTVSWSCAKSYDFCFLGVPQRSVVAVSAVGVRLERTLDYDLFLDGFQEMLRRLQPVAVLSYGNIPALCRELVEVIAYPTRWTDIRAARREGGKRRR